MIICIQTNNLLNAVKDTYEAGRSSMGWLLYPSVVLITIYNSVDFKLFLY